MYGDKITDSMQEAIEETSRRRKIQEEYNKEHNITPTTIKKAIREVISNSNNKTSKSNKKMTKLESSKIKEEIELEMIEAEKTLDFERAM